MITSFINLCKNLIDNDAEPVVHAHWKTDEEDIYWGNYLKKKRCSNCNGRAFCDKETQKFILSKYCPHCGAKMDEEVKK